MGVARPWMHLAAGGKETATGHGLPYAVSPGTNRLLGFPRIPVILDSEHGHVIELVSGPLKFPHTFRGHLDEFCHRGGRGCWRRCW